MVPYLFLAPLLVILLVFLLIPIVKAAIMSFQYYYIVRPSADGNYFVGLDNYKNLLSDSNFYNSVKVTVIYILVTVLGRYVLGFLTALLLNTKFKGRGIARALVIIPWAVPEVVACLVWMLMYDRDYGIINFLLNNAGILAQNIAYLQDVKVALPAALGANIWIGFPFVAIMLLAGMQCISEDLFEAADIDGATGWKKFRYITLPLLKPIMLYTLVTSAIGGLQMYDIPALFNVPETGLVGLPDDKTTTMAMYIMRLYNSDVGKAAAVSVVLFIITLVVSLILFATMSDSEDRRMKKEQKQRRKAGGRS